MIAASYFCEVSSDSNVMCMRDDSSELYHSHMLICDVLHLFSLLTAGVCSTHTDVLFDATCVVPTADAGLAFAICKILRNIFTAPQPLPHVITFAQAMCTC